MIKSPLSFSHFGETEFFDHSPMCVRLNSHQVRPKSSFMFMNYITRHPGFLPLMAQKWNEAYVRSTEMYSFAKRLKTLKKPIKELCKDNFSGLEKKS